MPLGKIVSKVAKKAAAKKATSANARGLKAAKGPSMAPKGYVPDTVGRSAVKKYQSDYGLYSYVAGEYVKLTPKEAAKYVDAARRSSQNVGSRAVPEMPKNVISKSGKKANTPKLMKKAAKKAK
jgi:hypothetical protein